MREPLRALEVPLGDLPIHLHEVGIVERKIPRHEDEQHDAARPDVCLGPDVALLVDDLRGHPEVGHLQVAILVKEEVLGLDVTVVHPSAVAKVDCLDQLLEVFPGHVLLELTLGHLVEQLAAFDVLHRKVDLGLARHDLVELHDVGVPHEAHHGDLTLDLVDQADSQHLLLVDDLDRHVLAGLQVPPVVDLRERALA
ncbi:hypothetical protein EUGRSUZ_L03403 [Eucalyptus grandis]|uniref:Uncharacterized protein n=1 Tax=Eucalyptus grandis TaxID=71139 RepID=A0AAD9T8V9_EUCGR|nr:hypothetical protein EUGRSUZ_L03403 [Eucalyptus grandis]